MTTNTKEPITKTIEMEGENKDREKEQTSELFWHGFDK